MQNLRHQINSSRFVLHVDGKGAFQARPGTRMRFGGTMHDQSRKSITALVFALSGLVASAALAQVPPIPQTPMAFKGDAPDRYVGVRRDTPRGVSGRLTDS